LTWVLPNLLQNGIETTLLKIPAIGQRLAARAVTNKTVNKLIVIIFLNRFSPLRPNVWVILVYSFFQFYLRFEALE
jgi:hypothetical protein